MCHMSGVPFYMSHVMCHIFSFFCFLQSSEACRCRIYYQQCLQRLVLPKDAICLSVRVQGVQKMFTMAKVSLLVPSGAHETCL